MKQHKYSIRKQPDKGGTGSTGHVGIKDGKAYDRAFFRSGASWLDYLADHAILPGMFLFSHYGYALARRFWTEPAGTLYGRKVVLTGGTSGIGKAAAFQLAEKKAFLTIIARNEKKAQQVQQEIVEKTGNPHVDYLLADLGLMQDIAKVA
ncbi:MAG: SDR family NAD(P)-dependent oxidoreductase, partial [Desulfotignum sp.]